MSDKISINKNQFSKILSLRIFIRHEQFDLVRTHSGFYSVYDENLIINNTLFLETLQVFESLSLKQFYPNEKHENDHVVFKIENGQFYVSKSLEYILVDFLFRALSSSISIRFVKEKQNLFDKIIIKDDEVLNLIIQVFDIIFVNKPYCYNSGILKIESKLIREKLEETKDFDFLNNLFELPIYFPKLNKQRL